MTLEEIKAKFREFNKDLARRTCFGCMYFRRKSYPDGTCVISCKRLGCGVIKTEHEERPEWCRGKVYYSWFDLREIPDEDKIGP